MKGPIALSMIPVVAVLVLAALPALSEEGGKTPISQYCASHGDLGLTHGACVAYFTTHNVAPHDATVCQDPGIQALLAVGNHGECVKKLQDLRR